MQFPILERYRIDTSRAKTYEWLAFKENYRRFSRKNLLNREANIKYGCMFYVLLENILVIILRSRRLTRLAMWTTKPGDIAIAKRRKFEHIRLSKFNYTEKVLKPAVSKIMKNKL